MSTEFLSDTPVGLGYSVNAEYNLSMLNGDYFGFGLPTATTQKARGIFFLQEFNSCITSNLPDWRIPRHLLFPAGTKFDDTCLNYPVFARPCPTVPRHGFVDSIVCHNGDELNALSQTTFEVESDAELLVTKPIPSTYNVIINGGVITFATGNDGATGGKGCQYFYIAEDPISKMVDLNSRQIIADGEVPFYELVLEEAEEESTQNKLTHLVQVRSAPHTPKVKDFVPAQVEVKLILKADGDLLAWEKLLKEVDPKTTIVDHTGGSLSSHYAIHAIVNRVPIFTSYVPELGSIIEPTVENTEIDDIDREKFYNAFVRGFGSISDIIPSLKYKNNNIAQRMREILILSLSTLHNFSSIAMSKDYEVLGIVLGLFSRVTFAVSAGECRYAYKTEGAMTKFEQFYKTLPCSDGRNPCYNHMMKRDAEACLDDAVIMYRIFKELHWSGAFGGKKWARCTKAAIDLFNACVNREITTVVELFNQVINAEHNGGKYLNKVIDVALFDEVAENPSLFTLQHLRTVVDWLHTSWRITPLEVKLHPIEIPLSKEKAVVTNKEIFLPYTIGSHFHTLLYFKDGTQHTINLTKPIPDNNAGSNCHCSGCIGADAKLELVSAPHWWTLDDGTKVISKVALGKIVADFNAKLNPVPQPVSESISDTTEAKSDEPLDQVTEQSVESLETQPKPPKTLVEVLHEISIITDDEADLLAKGAASIISDLENKT